MVGGLLAVVVIAMVALAQPGDAAPDRRLQTTTAGCRTALNSMLEDSNWRFMNNSLVRWCRMRLENEMARCCTIADFANGRGQGCGDCLADCVHQHFDDLCNKEFGKACVVVRKPFAATSLIVDGREQGTPDLVVRESFCVPRACDNNADKDALIPWYGTLYVSLLNGWHGDYDEATLECPSNVMTVLLLVIAGLVLFAAAVPISIMLFTAPKERGRTLISQADMQDDADDQMGMSDMYMTDQSSAGRLRNTAQGDTMGSGPPFAMTAGSG